MANPTVADLILRIRGMVREPTANFWADTDAQMLGFVTAGLEASHSAAKAMLQGAVPDPNSSYWRQFFTESTIALAANTQDYTLPSTEPARFDIFHSLVDATSLQPFYPYDIRHERDLARSFSNFADQPNYYAFVPGGKIRVLVTPGYRGVPQAARNLTLRHFRGIQHHESTGDTVDLRDEFCEAPCWYAIAKAFGSKQIAMNGPMDEFRAAMARVT